MFERLVIEVAQRQNLPTATISSVLSALIGAMTNERTGGINGFVDSFRRAGIGDAITSWFGGREGKPITPSHIESALGIAGVERIAEVSGVDRSTASAVVALLLPKMMGLLTPTGTLPTNTSVKSTASLYLHRATPVPHRSAEPRGSTRWLPWAAVAALALLAVVWMRNRGTNPEVVADSARVVQEAAGSVALPSGTSSMAPMAADLIDETWQWTGMSTPAGLRTIDTPERYTVRFDSAGRVSVRADCNRGSATYSVRPNREIRLNPLALTRAMCPTGSMSDQFAAQVGRVTRYEVRAGDLYLSFPTESTTLRFRRAAN